MKNGDIGQEDKNGWISVERGLPPSGESVLVFPPFFRKNAELDEIKPNGDWCSGHLRLLGAPLNKMPIITHWHSLPSPPAPELETTK